MDLLKLQNNLSDTGFKEWISGRMGGTVEHEVFDLIGLMSIDDLLKLICIYLEETESKKKNYKNAFEAAEKYINKSPCDPDITEEQHKAYNNYIVWATKDFSLPKINTDSIIKPIKPLT